MNSVSINQLDLSGGSNNLTHLELSQVTGLKQLNLRPAAASLQDLRLYYCQLDEFNSPPLKPGIKLDILATPLKAIALPCSKGHRHGFGCCGQFNSIQKVAAITAAMLATDIVQAHRWVRAWRHPSIKNI